MDKQTERLITILHHRPRGEVTTRPSAFWPSSQQSLTSSPHQIRRLITHSRLSSPRQLQLTIFHLPHRQNLFVHQVCSGHQVKMLTRPDLLLVTPRTSNQLKQLCRHIFDEKTGRALLLARHRYLSIILSTHKMLIITTCCG